MPLVLMYFLKVSVSVAIVWLFYQVLLRRLTFYNWNRWYLLGYTLLSFFIPLIDVGPVMQLEGGEPLVIRFIPAMGRAAAPASRFSELSSWTLVQLIIGFGSIVLLARLAVQWFSLSRVRKGARLLEDGEVKIYILEGAVRPFSFGKAMYVNPRLHTEKEWEEIILHEYVHIRQKHSMDILFMELYCAVCWFNPFAWFMRYAIRQNLEFIADRRVLEHGVDRKGYQYHLLKVVGAPAYRLANSFNFSSLKKRIIMMNKIRSARLHLVKFLFILPLIGVLLVAFRNKVDGLWTGHGRHSGHGMSDPGDSGNADGSSDAGGGSFGPRVIHAAGMVFDVDDKTAIADVLVRDAVTGLETHTDSRGFYRLMIPVTADSVRVSLSFKKAGYEDGVAGSFFPSVKESRGDILVSVMGKPGVARHETFAAFPFGNHPTPLDPGYDDVLTAWKEMVKINSEVSGMMKMKKDNPEIALFYTTEDKEHQLVFFKGGDVEKYGYPGGPTIADMEKKYGKLPGLMKPGLLPTAGRGYVSQWAAIAAEAEKRFHTSNPDAAKVIFPGDSRVIVVTVSGRIDIYDMDSNDPKERPAFEKLYGKLPDCLPAASAGAIAAGRSYELNVRTDTVPAKNTVNWMVTPVADAGAVARVNVKRSDPGGLSARPAGDTGGRMVVVRKKGDTSVSPRVFVLSDTSKPLPDGALIVVNGEVKPASFKVSSIPPDSIYSMDVYKGEKATALFGDKAEKGALVIVTPGFRRQHPPMKRIDAVKVALDPLYIIDGKEMRGANALKSINPDDIESINVLKDEAAIDKYGEKGRNGVLIVKLKKKSGS